MNKAKALETIKSHYDEELNLARNESGGAPSSPKIAEIERLLTMIRFLPKREYNDEDVAIPSALLELKVGTNAQPIWALLVPTGGGLVTRVEEKPLLVLTPESPLGGALMGHKKGDRVEVTTLSSEKRVYEILSIR